MQDNNFQEIPVTFECLGHKLIGIIHRTDAISRVGVLIIVGGPQYRVGSHRQFILLARYLAARDIPAMRFDVRGMGDSEGESRSFEEIEDDINAAVNCFFASCPEISQVVLWGLCDGASAALFYAYQDNRIKGLVLLNPWVFTQQGEAKTYLKHYYLQRLLSLDFWQKVLAFKFDYRQSLLTLLSYLKQASGKTEEKEAISIAKIDQNLVLPIRMRECLKRFSHPVLLILSGRDLTAAEFKETVKADPEWQALLNKSRLTRHDCVEADHTFSSEVWREQVAEWTSSWIKNQG